MGLPDNMGGAMGREQRDWQRDCRRAEPPSYSRQRAGWAVGGGCVPRKSPGQRGAVSPERPARNGCCAHRVVRRQPRSRGGATLPQTYALCADFRQFRSSKKEKLAIYILRPMYLPNIGATIRIKSAGNQHLAERNPSHVSTTHLPIPRHQLRTQNAALGTRAQRLL